MTQQQLEAPSWIDEHARAVADFVEYALATSDLDALLRRALEAAVAGLSVSHAMVAELDAAGDALLARARLGWDRPNSNSVLQQITERAQQRRALRRGCTAILDEKHAEQSQLLSPQSLAENGLSAAIGIVIRGESAPYGLLAVFAEVPASFDQADAHFLRTIANVLAISIARLRADEQRTMYVAQVTQAKNEWERTVDALPELVCLLDQSGCVIRANRALEQWRLGTVRSVRGRSVHALLHPACGDWDCPLDWDCQDAWQAVAKQDVVEREVYDRLQARELRLSYRSCAPPAHEASEAQTSCAVLVVEDISDRKRAQRAMEQYNQELQCRVQERTLELRALSSQLLNAQETERKRIASELHDGIGQCLSAVKFNVESILRGLDGQSAQVDREQLQAVVERIRAAIEEVRRISMDLRPSTLDDLGIVATIGWFCREFQAVLPELELVKTIKVQESDISDTLKLVIFRILQEALNNIAKHADAKRVFIDLTKVDREIRLSIRDDGEGFELAEETMPSSGFGLKSMKERTELSAGIFSMRSARGAGTTIEARWPPSPA